MKTQEEALLIVRNWIENNPRSNYKLNEDLIEEMQNGWIFHFIPFTLFDSYSNLPLFVDKHNGNIFQFNFFFKEETISKYESEQGYI